MNLRINILNLVKKKLTMTPNKQTVNEYMAAFMVSDHKRILACLTDDIVWEMPGIYRHVGKEAFDKEIENETDR